MKILGIFPSINSAACLMIDGKVVAMVEEERLNRIKTGGADIPFKSIKYVLGHGKLSIYDIDHIAVGWDFSKYPKYFKEYSNKHLKSKLQIDELIEDSHSLHFNPDLFSFKLKIGLASHEEKDRSKFPPIKFVPHHLCHAASAFYTSGFEESTVLTIDGSGEENATVIWHAKGNEINKVKEINIPNSLGWFYSAITEFIGFQAYTGEGKVMGLAPYGKPNMEIRKKLQKIITINEEDYQIDPTYIYYDKRTYSRRYTDKLVELLGPPNKDIKNFSDYYKDIAYEVQFLLELAVGNLVRSAIKITGSANICISGGVGMNCKMNGKVYQMPEVKNVSVFPASSDNGVCLGAAFQISSEHGVKIENKKITNVYWGPEYSNEAIKVALDLCKLRYTYHENIELETAKRIANSKIIGWFQGRMEVGARALGNRSIIANPMNPKMKDILNAQVKHRESFRPFCPSVLFEEKEKYVEDATLAPFMIFAFTAKSGMQEKLPSVVHVDNTIRVQTVRKEDNLRYWNLINEFKNITGHGVIINTSFNIAGEPIVCKPEEAIRCFFGTGIDCLVLGNYMLEKEEK